MSSRWPTVPLGDVISHRKQFEIIDDRRVYRRCRVQLHAKGVVLRDEVPGLEIRTKKQQICRTGEFLVAEIDAKLGGYGIVPESLEGSIVSSHYFLFGINTEKLCRKFLAYFLRTPGFADQVAAQGSTNYAAVRPGHVLAYKIPLPPISAQRRIVARIDALAEKIAEAVRLQAQTEGATTALRLSAANEMIAVREPAKWPMVRLGDLSEVRSGVTLGRVLSGTTVRMPYLRVANVQDGSLDLNEVKEIDVLRDESTKWRLEKGDLLLTEGGDWDKLGRGTVWENEIPGCIHQNHIFRVRANPDKCNPYYLAAVVASPYGRSYFQSASKQTTNLASINQRQLKAFPIPMPSLAEQRNILARLNGLLGKAKTAKEHHDAITAELNALLPSILDRAFRGELLPEIGSTKITIPATVAAKKPAATTAPGTAPQAKKPTPFKDDAAVLCVLTEELLKLDRPTDEFCLQKHTYMGHERWKLPINSTFKREAAGPWSQQLTHKAIYAATQQNWLRWDNGQLVPGRSFQRGLAHAATLPDDARSKARKTVSDLSKFGDHGLERWATVLMAARDLQAANKPVSHATIQQEIDQWPGKRSKEIFTEESVEKTIDAMARHGWLKDLQ